MEILHYSKPRNNTASQVETSSHYTVIDVRQNKIRSIMNQLEENFQRSIKLPSLDDSVSQYVNLLDELKHNNRTKMKRLATIRNAPEGGLGFVHASNQFYTSSAMIGRAGTSSTDNNNRRVFTRSSSLKKNVDLRSSNPSAEMETEADVGGRHSRTLTTSNSYQKLADSRQIKQNTFSVQQDIRFQRVEAKNLAKQYKQLSNEQEVTTKRIDMLRGQIAKMQKREDYLKALRTEVERYVADYHDQIETLCNDNSHGLLGVLQDRKTRTRQAILSLCQGLADEQNQLDHYERLIENQEQQQREQQQRQIMLQHYIHSANEQLKVWIKLHQTLNRNFQKKESQTPPAKKKAERRNSIDLHQQLLNEVRELAEGKNLSEEVFLDEYWRLKNSTDLQHRNYLALFELKKQLLADLQRIDGKKQQYELTLNEARSQNSGCDERQSQKILLAYAQQIRKVCEKIYLEMRLLEESPIDQTLLDFEINKLKNFKKKLEHDGARHYEEILPSTAFDILKQIKKTLLKAFEALKQNPPKSELRILSGSSMWLLNVEEPSGNSKRIVSRKRLSDRSLMEPKEQKDNRNSKDQKFLNTNYQWHLSRLQRSSKMLQLKID